jgi:hypothetical protein
VSIQRGDRGERPGKPALPVAYPIALADLRSESMIQIYQQDTSATGITQVTITVHIEDSRAMAGNDPAIDWIDQVFFALVEPFNARYRHTNA